MADIELNRKDKRALVAHVAEVLTTTMPSQYITGHNEDWFYINDRGQVALNLRNSTYSTGLIIKRYAKTNLLDLHETLEEWDFDNDHFYYQILQSALNSKKVKEFKTNLKKRKTTTIKSKAKKELKQIEHKMATLRTRRTELLAVIGGEL